MERNSGRVLLVDVATGEKIATQVTPYEPHCLMVLICLYIETEGCLK